MRLTRINDKMTHKLKHMESMNSMLSSELEDAHTKVSQLDLKCSILPEQLNGACIKVNLPTKHGEKAEKDLERLQSEVASLKSKKADLDG